MNIPIQQWATQAKCLSPIKNSAGVEVDKVASLHCIPVILQNFVNIALLFSGFVALFLILYAGIIFITSRADKAKIESARNTLTYAIIGLIIIIFSYAIVNLIFTLAGYRR